VYKGRTAHVVSVPEGIIPTGCVPIMYDDEGNCFVPVPADDLTNRFGKTVTLKEGRETEG